MSKALVAYFTASGNTASLANKLANVIHADMFEIRPMIAYTSDDLDWTNKQSRSSIEMNNKKFRPEIANKVSNIEQYEVIFVGFPIWWYVAPTIINTFLEQYDLTNKIIIPFATSGGSMMGNTNHELAPSCKGAILKTGKRWALNASESELKEWAESMLK